MTTLIHKKSIDLDAERDEDGRLSSLNVARDLRLKALMMPSRFLIRHLIGISMDGCVSPRLSISGTLHGP